MGSPYVRRPVDPRLAARLAWLQDVARLLDDAFRVPGTRLRFGWDPILGIIPGAGDAVVLVYAILLIVTGMQMRIPRVVLARMVVNALLDFGIGLIPIAGDLFDFFFRANMKNLALLERHAFEAQPPRAEDWAVVIGLVALLVAVLALPFVFVAWLLWTLGVGVV